MKVLKMGQDNIFETFNNGLVIFPSKNIDVSALPWYEHPAFKGVYLKDLVRGDDTKGAFSCHVVKIKKGSEVGEHSHSSQWEFNEALEGNGTFVIHGEGICLQSWLFLCDTTGHIPHRISPRRGPIHTGKIRTGAPVN